jgi:hypothetical protein
MKNPRQYSKTTVNLIPQTSKGIGIWSTWAVQQSVKWERCYYLIPWRISYIMIIIAILVNVHLASNVYILDNNSQLDFQVNPTKWATLRQNLFLNWNSAQRAECTYCEQRWLEFKTFSVIYFPSLTIWGSVVNSKRMIFILSLVKTLGTIFEYGLPWWPTTKQRWQECKQLIDVGGHVCSHL